VPHSNPYAAITGAPEDASSAEAWARFVQAFRVSAERLPAPWNELFGPLRNGGKDGQVVVGQIGQSLDGRVATLSGDSKYINGPYGLAHLHRLRALVDAVVIGVRTALADDPQLTVRRVAGPNPARVVLDPHRRLPPSARVFTEDGTRRLLFTCEHASKAVAAGVEIVSLPSVGGHMPPIDILAALAQRGLRRVLVEGGAETVSRFLAAGCLDRLHVIVAPIILGGGRPGFVLPPVDRVERAARIPIRSFRLGDDLLFDCDLSTQRKLIGSANRST
jgi:diaminohydroxyphosphoribosylaminopyrimidine deaminase / 5-amino-6-(5-phosphoribosylamino)uracil reductase